MTTMMSKTSANAKNEQRETGKNGEDSEQLVSLQEDTWESDCCVAPPFTHPKRCAAKLVHCLILHADTFNRPANLFLDPSRFAPVAFSRCASRRGAPHIYIHAHTHTHTPSPSRSIADRRPIGRKLQNFRPSCPHLFRHVVPLIPAWTSQATRRMHCVRHEDDEPLRRSTVSAGVSIRESLESRLPSAPLLLLAPLLMTTTTITTVTTALSLPPPPPLSLSHHHYHLRYRSLTTTAAGHPPPKLQGYLVSARVKEKDARETGRAQNNCSARSLCTNVFERIRAERVKVW